MQQAQSIHLTPEEASFLLYASRAQVLSMLRRDLRRGRPQAMAVDLERVWQNTLADAATALRGLRWYGRKAFVLLSLIHI